MSLLHQAVGVSAVSVVDPPLLSMASAMAPETKTKTEFPEFPEFPEFAAVALELEFPIEFVGLSPFLVFSWVSWIVGWMDGFNSMSHKIHS